jgi:hypothetical protein
MFKGHWSNDLSGPCLHCAQGMMLDLNTPH